MRRIPRAFASLGILLTTAVYTPGGLAAAEPNSPESIGSAAANWDQRLWDPTLPAIPSAFVSGDPIAIINSLLGMSSTSALYTADMGRNFLRKMGILPTPTGYTNGAIPRVYGRQASEYVIRRAGSQIGVPYSWGGGNAAGPSTGIDSGSNTVGFDCSQHVALYLGNGQMLEAPFTGSQVKVSPVRTSGMTPYVVRYIEY